MKKRIIPVLTCVAVLFILLFILMYYKKSARNAIETFAQNRKMINILIAGNYEYKNNKCVFYSVLSYNPERNKIGITFIPPEFKVNLDGKGKTFKKISEVDINDFKALSESIERDLKLNTPFYVVLYSPDVERIVDMIEGIDLYVLDGTNTAGVQPGLNYFDGEKINEYINSVGENSIYKKYDRIQDILLTLYSSKEKYEKFFDSEFIAEILKTVKTNLLTQEIVSLAKLLNKKESDLICTVLPGFLSENNFYVADDIAYKIYKNDFLKKLIVENDAEQQVKVKILNGTDIQGLARKVRHRFVNEGFNVVEFGTAPNTTFEKTVIINRRGEMGPARKVAKLLGTERIYQNTDSTQLTNVLIILGADIAK